MQANLPDFHVRNSVYLLMNQVSPGSEEALSEKFGWVISLGSQGLSYHWLIVVRRNKLTQGDCFWELAMHWILDL